MMGRHSVENIMAAILAVREIGAKPEVIQEVINDFPGLPHRIEYVRKAGGVLFYNDSKATNVHAVARALDAFDENVILIMGGKETGVNFESLAPFIKQKVKTLILVGEAKEKINRDQSRGEKKKRKAEKCYIDGASKMCARIRRDSLPQSITSSEGTFGGKVSPGKQATNPAHSRLTYEM